MSTDKKIDLWMCGVNLFVLLIPLVIMLFFKIDFFDYFVKTYFYSSTTNKFAIVLSVCTAIMLIKQHNIPPNPYGKTKIKDGFRKFLIGVVIFFGAVLAIIDLILLILSLLSSEPIEKVRYDLIAYIAAAGFAILILTNFFSIIFLKKYDLSK